MEKLTPESMKLAGQIDSRPECLANFGFYQIGTPEKLKHDIFSEVFSEHFSPRAENLLKIFFSVCFSLLFLSVVSFSVCFFSFCCSPAMDMQQLAVQAVVAGIFFWWFETTTFLLLFFFLSHFYNVYSCQQLSGEITSLNEKIARLERENAKARSHSARRRRGDKGKEKEEPHEEKSPKGSKIQKKESRSISPLREREENVFGSSPAPELPIKVMDLASSVEKEVYPNWRAPTPISNDWFEVSMKEKKETKKKKKKKEKEKKRRI